MRIFRRPISPRLRFDLAMLAVILAILFFVCRALIAKEPFQWP